MQKYFFSFYVSDFYSSFLATFPFVRTRIEAEAQSNLGYIIEKGSIALDGISLSTHTLIDDTFKVSLIPYTLEYTNANQWHEGGKVNIEFDFLAKYLQRNLHLKSSLE